MKTRPLHTSSITKQKHSNSLRSPLWIKKNTRQNVVSNRLSYSFPLLPPPYMTQEWIQNILVPVRVCLDITCYIVVYLKIAITGLR